MFGICMTEPDLKIIVAEGDTRSKVADVLGGMAHVCHHIRSRIKCLHVHRYESMCSSVRKIAMIKLIDLLNDSSNHVIEKI